MNEQIPNNQIVQLNNIEETPMTKRMKSQFSFFGLASAIYALFYAFCLFENASGITYPFFVAGTLCYFFFSMKKLGVPYKKNSLFYVISMILLGISNCCTDSTPLLFMNKLGIFLLAFILMLHTIYHDKGWNFPKYIGAICRTIGISITCIFNPLLDLSAYLKSRKQIEHDKKSYAGYILLGFVISIPLLTIIILLLCSADAVFRTMVDNIFSFDFSFGRAFRINLLIAVVFFASYALIAALCKKTVEEEVKDRRIFEPVVAITVTGMLTIVYLIFSMIQILYLFIGNMQLPEGYTYSAYAREGFFQLLAVCILNLILVLFCVSFFRDNLILKIILTVISGCTFIMILSSALRMFMYIARYNLTFLRIFVLWALAVIFLLIIGVTVYIYHQSFPLFFYSVAVVTVFYICLSFFHPDYWIAKYNLQPSHIEYLNDYDIKDSKRYLYRLSADAAPFVLWEEKNPYLSEAEEDDAYYFSYCHRVQAKVKKMDIRSFNFSIYRAKGYLPDISD